MIEVTRLLTANERQPILVETASGGQRGTAIIHRYCPLESSELEKKWEVSFQAEKVRMIDRVAELLLLA